MTSFRNSPRTSRTCRHAGPRIESFERTHERAGRKHLDFDAPAAGNVNRLGEANCAGLSPGNSWASPSPSSVAGFPARSQVIGCSEPHRRSTILRRPRCPLSSWLLPPWMTSAAARGNCRGKRWKRTDADAVCTGLFRCATPVVWNSRRAALRQAQGGPRGNAAQAGCAPQRLSLRRPNQRMM